MYTAVEWLALLLQTQEILSLTLSLKVILMKYFMVFLSFSLQISHSILRQMMTTSFTSSFHCLHYDIIQCCVIYAAEKHFKMIQEF